VIEWNNVLIGALRADRTLPGPGWASRNAAIVHTAIFDAVDAIDGSYQPFLVHASAPRRTPIAAAVAGAAWRVLSNLYPAQKATFDAALATALARVPDGKREDAGVALGVSVADEILAARAGDGSDVRRPLRRRHRPRRLATDRPRLHARLGTRLGPSDALLDAQRARSSVRRPRRR